MIAEVKNIIFFGSNRYNSIKALKKLLTMNQFNVAYCINDTNDFSDELNKLCLLNNVKFFSKKEFLCFMEEMNIEDISFGISYSYHKLIPKEIIDLCKKIINFHPSPLPEHRGVAGSSYAIMKSLKEWGVSAHYVDERFDTGQIIRVNRFNICLKDLTGILLDRMIQDKMFELFDEIVSDSKIPDFESYKQSKGKYFSFMDLESAKKIDVNNIDKKSLNSLIEGLWFPPFDGAYVDIQGEKFTLVNRKILLQLEKVYKIYFNHNEKGEKE